MGARNTERHDRRALLALEMSAAGHSIKSIADVFGVRYHQAQSILREARTQHERLRRLSVKRVHVPGELVRLADMRIACARALGEAFVEQAIQGDEDEQRQKLERLWYALRLVDEGAEYLLPIVRMRVAVVRRRLLDAHAEARVEVRT